MVIFIGQSPNMVIHDSDKFDKVNAAAVRTKPKMMQVEVGRIVWI